MLVIRLALLLAVFGLVGSDLLHFGLTWDEQLEFGLPGFAMLRDLCEEYNLELSLLIIGTLLAIWHVVEMMIMAIKQFRR